MAEDERWPWRARVLDDQGEQAYVKVRAEDGIVHVEGPAVYRADPEEADLLTFAMKSAADRARFQRIANS